MALRVPTSRIPQRGVPTLTASAVFVAALALVVGFGLLGRDRATTPVPTIPAVVPRVATPTPATTPSFGTCAAARLSPVSDPMPRHPAELAPTGIAPAAVPAPGLSRLVRDRDGSLWEFRSGHLLHVDAAGSPRQAWSVANDASFDAWGIAPAREGGVWLFGASALRWFDGTRFRDVVPPPPGRAVTAMAEGPDGAVWVVSSAPSPLRWDGTAWVRVDDCAPIPASFSLSAVAIDTDGGVWVGRQDTSSADGRGEALLSHLADGVWIHFGPSDSAALRGPVLDMEPATDGSVWVGTTAGVLQVTKAGEAVTHAGDLAGTISIDPRPDASAIVATAGTPANWYAYTIRTISPVGRVSEVVGQSPPVSLLVPGWMTVRETTGGVFASTWSGLLRFEAGRRTVVATSSGPRSAAHMVALSGTSVWVAYASGVGHLSGTGWVEDPPVASLIPARDLAWDPGGRIWEATDVGVLVYQQRQWHGPWGGAAVSVAIADDGSAWLGMFSGDVEHVRLDGQNLETETVTRPPLTSVQTIAVGPDGTIWAGSRTDGLARFDGRAWTRLNTPLSSSTPGAGDIAIAPDGDVWVVLVAQRTGPAMIARLHGSEWTVWNQDYGVPSSVGSLAVAPDGTVWAAGDGLARFDGRRWVTGLRGVALGPVSVAPDGTVMVAGPGGIYRVASRP